MPATSSSKGRAAGTSAGRVIAGSARGIRLVGPGEGTRPLGDRLKQSLFAILEPGIRDSPFLDLFAGSGAAGLEALSRGASRTVFVERDQHAIGVIQANLNATGLADRATVVRADVVAWLDSTGRNAGPFANLFLDPPYAEPNVLDVSLARIDSLGPDGILSGHGALVAKHSRGQVPADLGRLRPTRQQRFGDTILTFYRWADEVDA